MQTHTLLQILYGFFAVWSGSICFNQMKTPNKDPIKWYDHLLYSYLVITWFVVALLYSYWAVTGNV